MPEPDVGQATSPPGHALAPERSCQGRAEEVRGDAAIPPGMGAVQRFQMLGRPWEPTQAPAGLWTRPGALERGPGAGHRTGRRRTGAALARQRGQDQEWPLHPAQAGGCDGDEPTSAAGRPNLLTDSRADERCRAAPPSSSWSTSLGSDVRSGTWKRWSGGHLRCLIDLGQEPLDATGRRGQTSGSAASQGDVGATILGPQPTSCAAEGA